jgi:hypothetical protein
VFSPEFNSDFEAERFGIFGGIVPAIRFNLSRCKNERGFSLLSGLRVSILPFCHHLKNKTAIMLQQKEAIKPQYHYFSEFDC